MYLDTKWGSRMTNLINDSVWIKASALVKEKYGKNLSYRSIKLISDNISDSGCANACDDFYASGDDLIIPLKLKDFNLGDVIVSRGTQLNQQQKIEVMDLVKFLVEPKIYSMQLQQIESNLHTFINRPLSLVTANSVVPLYQSETFHKKTLSQIILLKSNNELNCNKVALKIHDMTKRNLFVHLDDIISSLTSKEDIRTLTDVSIYTQNIESLPVSTLFLLQDYFAWSESNSPNGPLFLMGSSLSLAEIQVQVWADSLKKDLMGFYFDIDRVPLSQQTSPEILELLFFQLEDV